MKFKDLFDFPANYLLNIIYFIILLIAAIIVGVLIYRTLYHITK